ncbi:MAG TPA: hypothetical protein VGJ78_10945 [Vicinamibacterales bacterium]
MTRNKPVAAALAVMLLLFASAYVWAQGGTANKRTFLTFSAPVQVPGTTLPAGTYVFRLANPNAQTIWQVLDGRERRILSTFFDVPGPRRTTQDQNRAGGRPVVTMGETPQDIPPAIRVLYYPTDLYGSVLIYPREQAQLIANATRQPVPATDNDATRGGAATIFTVEPEATVARNNEATEEQAPAVVEEPAPSRVEPTPQVARSQSRPAATPRRQARASSAPEQPVGTGGRDESQAGQTASKPLPRTASPLPLVGLVGLLALAAGIGLRVARRAAARQ